ncbi:uncharacterized protein BXZ73DRAFT_80133 [Epithele typhae]|uniref:uncharacterized protein n=1 Tax=Epithele typhae TaxID=378194 RepID=UPI0020089577|nr:uncharacterized protein BXZ73DRAFT_80133 [Epithele typhae]KAH9920562.1 hypothetical protein BXZ73DRAFT_80133 [Epithele typhae]
MALQQTVDLSGFKNLPTDIGKCKDAVRRALESVQFPDFNTYQTIFNALSPQSYLADVTLIKAHPHQRPINHKHLDNLSLALRVDMRMSHQAPIIVPYPVWREKRDLMNATSDPNQLPRLNLSLGSDTLPMSFSHGHRFQILKNIPSMGDHSQTLQRIYGSPPMWVVKIIPDFLLDIIPSHVWHTIMYLDNKVDHLQSPLTGAQMMVAFISALATLRDHLYHPLRNDFLQRYQTHSLNLTNLSTLYKRTKADHFGGSGNTIKGERCLSHPILMQALIDGLEVPYLHDNLPTTVFMSLNNSRCWPTSRYLHHAAAQVELLKDFPSRICFEMLPNPTRSNSNRPKPTTVNTLQDIREAVQSGKAFHHLVLHHSEFKEAHTASEVTLETLWPTSVPPLVDPKKPQLLWQTIFGKSGGVCRDLLVRLGYALSPLSYAFVGSDWLNAVANMHYTTFHQPASVFGQYSWWCSPDGHALAFLQAVSGSRNLASQGTQRCHPTMLPLKEYSLWQLYQTAAKQDLARLDKVADHFLLHAKDFINIYEAVCKAHSTRDMVVEPFKYQIFPQALNCPSNMMREEFQVVGPLPQEQKFVTEQRYHNCLQALFTEDLWQEAFQILELPEVFKDVTGNLPFSPLPKSCFCPPSPHISPPSHHISPPLVEASPSPIPAPFTDEDPNLLQTLDSEEVIQAFGRAYHPPSNDLEPALFHEQSPMQPSLNSGAQSSDDEEIPVNNEVQDHSKDDGAVDHPQLVGTITPTNVTPSVPNRRRRRGSPVSRSSSHSSEGPHEGENSPTSPILPVHKRRRTATIIRMHHRSTVAPSPVGSPQYLQSGNDDMADAANELEEQVLGHSQSATSLQEGMDEVTSSQFQGYLSDMYNSQKNQARRLLTHSPMSGKHSQVMIATFTF